MYPGFQKFKQCHVLTITYISKSKETIKVLLNIRIILSPNKNQLLRKQQFVNYFVEHLRETTEFEFLYFTSFLKNCGKYILLSSQ